jgi:hypothetical protein
MKDVVRAALLTTKSTLGLCFIADATRDLMGNGYTMADVHATILSLSEDGEIDLRTDGGSQYLAEDDERHCPPGPRGSVFSRCRFLER